MGERAHGVLWPAEPHTLAKIAMLKSYLYAWFNIFGRPRTPGKVELLYVDGFAGPGRYTNSDEGSPIAALNAAQEVLGASGQAWTAGEIHCAFIESEQQIFAHLERHLAPFANSTKPHVHLIQNSFVEGLAQLRGEMPGAFTGTQPLFVFIDPFGATGVPFATVQDILSSPRSEVLINLDADGFDRILKAGESANRDALLTRAFGNESWRELLSRDMPFRDRVQAIVELYKGNLRSLPNVRYVFSFEMLTSKKSVGKVGYFLIFAGQHRRGLEKMKEAMRSVDQIGAFQFSNARVGQPALFRFDQPGQYADQLYRRFAPRQRVTYDEIWDYALDDTPFEHPRKMLQHLERAGRITVTSTDPKRRKGTFNPDKIRWIEFKEGKPDG